MFLSRSGYHATRWLTGELRLPECFLQTGANASALWLKQGSSGVGEREYKRVDPHTKQSIPGTNGVRRQRNFDLVYTVGRIQMRMPMFCLTLVLSCCHCDPKLSLWPEDNTGFQPVSLFEPLQIKIKSKSLLSHTPNCFSAAKFLKLGQQHLLSRQ